MTLKRILYILIILFVLIQLWPSDRPEVISENPNDFLLNNEVPQEMTAILKTACYDCHSNETHYPWYAYVAPVKWLVNEDVEHGRRDLNFSTWAELDRIEQVEMLEEIAEEVEEGEMPMEIYTYTHSNAKLSDEDRKAVAEWAESLAESYFED